MVKLNLSVWLLAAVLVVGLIAVATSDLSGYASAASCTDSDGWNKDVAGTCKDNSGTYMDSCTGTGGRGYFEYYCSSGVCKKAPKICPQGQVCQNGACVPKPQPLSCKDSDGGSDLGTAGTCTDNKGSYGDYCWQANKGVAEQTCSPAYGNCTLTFTMCPAGTTCQNGACVQKQCTDTDGGVVGDVAGTCTDSAGSYTDWCSGGMATLQEYYCDATDNTCKGKLVTCQCIFGNKCDPNAPIYYG